MYEAMNIAATGLYNQQRRLDTIANNVANVNTAAFKNARLDFKDALYTAGYIPGKARSPEENQQKGHGVMIAGIVKDFSTGSLIRTDRSLDLAIEGEGFYALSDPDGNTVYTRNGSFNLSTEDDGVYLVNSDGLYIQDADGERIRFPELTSGIRVDTKGVITFTVERETTIEAEEGEEAEVVIEEVELASVQLGIFTFRNISGLLSAGSGNYAESAASGERRIADEAVIRQGVIEGSNVKLADEMTRLIRTQRAFTLSSRALRTADDMEGIANNMKK